MGTFPHRQYLRGDRFAIDPATGAQLRWGVPSGGGDPRWLLVGGSVVEAISAAPWRFRGLESQGEPSSGIVPLPEGTMILYGSRLLVMEHGAPRDVGTITTNEEG